MQDGKSWHFISQKGFFHSFLTDGKQLIASEPWSLFNDKEREEDWRISGLQHLAVHQQSQQAYVLVHQGPPESFEDPGTHIWVYDLASGNRINEIKLERMAISIAVSQDSQAQLYSIAANFNLPFLFQMYVYLMEGEKSLEKHLKLVLDVYELNSGEFLRSIDEIGNYPSYIQVWPATVKAPMIDPVFYWTISIILALLWCRAAINKLQASQEFAELFAAYHLVPQSVAPSMAMILPCVELLVAVLLLLPATQIEGGLASAALLAIYAMAMALNLLRGRIHIDCGCHFGGSQTISWRLVTRNILLACLSLILLLPVVTRLLSVGDILLISAFCFVIGLSGMMLQAISNLRSAAMGAE